MTTEELLAHAWKCGRCLTASREGPVSVYCAEITEKILKERDALIEKYQGPAPKCNRGHENNLPLALWNCPQCTDHHVKENVELKAEVKRLHDILWTPHTEDFLESVQIEAAHQRDRFPDAHDKLKDDTEWFWILGFLAGKILKAPDQQKRLHHIVTSAALLLNWHRVAKEKGEANV